MATNTGRGWPRLQLGEFFAETWKVTRLIGEGNYGSVYEVQKTPGTDKCALKVQWLKPKPMDQEESSEDDGRWRLKMDVQALRALRDAGFATSAHCRYVEWGYSEELSYLITALGGPDLHEMKKRLPQHRYSLWSALFLAEGVLRAIHELHRVGFIHRDVKPHNFVIGREGDFRSVYMIDLGMTRRWTLEKASGVDYDKAETEVRMPRVSAGFRGSLRYASLTTHLEHDLGRVDDLWQWFFMLVDFTVDSLPWDRELTQPNLTLDERSKRIKDAKERTVCTSDKILDGCPHEYTQIYNFLKPLKYFDRPDYRSLLEILRTINSRKGYTTTMPLDWEPSAGNLTVVPAKSIAAVVKSNGPK